MANFDRLIISRILFPNATLLDQGTIQKDFLATALIAIVVCYQMMPNTYGGYPPAKTRPHTAELQDCLLTDQQHDLLPSGQKTCRHRPSGRRWGL